MPLQRIFVLIAILITAVLGVYAAHASFLRPYTGLSIAVDGAISSLDPNGPAAIVGIDTTDRIVTINGSALNASDAFYQGVSIGDPVTFEILRGNRQLQFALTTVPFPSYLLANRLVIMALGFIFWGFGFSLFLRNPQKFSVTDFVLFTISIATALFALEDAERGYIWARYAMYCALPISGAAWLNIHRNFPITVGNLWQQICGLSYAIAAILTLTTLTVGPNTLTQLATDLGLSPQVPSNIIRIIWTLECIAGLYLLIQGYRIQSGDSRRRVRFVTIGSLIGLVPVAITLTAEAVAFYGIPNTIALTGLVALPVTYSISLTQADILQLETRFYRTLIIFTLVILIPLIYLGSLSILHWLSPGLATHPVTGALIALLLAVTSGKVHSRVSEVFSRIFFAETPDHPKQLAVLTSALKKLATQLDERTVISLLTKQIPAEINVAKAGLWFMENNVLVWKGGEFKEDPKVTLGEDITLIRDVRLAKPHLFINKSFPSGESIRWWIPLVTSDGGDEYELHGVWLLGQRQNDESFSPDDIELIHATAQESALAVKAIQLLAQLHFQLSQTELAWRRTNRIREEEQQRIANDLHDDVIQLMFYCGLYIQSAIRQFREGNSPVETLESTLNNLDEVAKKTRLICLDLRPDALTRLDLATMLMHVVKQTQSRMPSLDIKFASTKSTTAYLEYLETQNLLNPQTKIGLYRIAQEALNNVTKHANATSVTINLQANTEGIRLQIIDNGKGFDVGQTTRQGHGLGLTTIYSRATDLNAMVEIDSDINVGTRIDVSLSRSALEKTDVLPQMVYV